MKKYLAIILAVILVSSMTLTLASCKKDEPVNDESGVVVTDENGDEVTDKNGDVVTEPVTDAQEASSNDKTSDKNNNSNNTSSNKTTKKNNKTTSKGKKPSKNNNKTTEKKTTKKETTTKAKTRKVTLTVNLPYYFDSEQNMVVYYKLLDEKVKKGEKPQWQKLDPIPVVFNDSSYEVDLGKLKGAVAVVVKFEDKKMNSQLQNDCNRTTIPSNVTHGSVTLVTGIENVTGEWEEEGATKPKKN